MGYSSANITHQKKTHPMTWIIVCVRIEESWVTGWVNKESEPPLAIYHFSKLFFNLHYRLWMRSSPLHNCQGSQESRRGDKKLCLCPPFCLLKGGRIVSVFVNWQLKQDCFSSLILVGGLAFNYSSTHPMTWMTVCLRIKEGWVIGWVSKERGLEFVASNPSFGGVFQRKLKRGGLWRSKLNIFLHTPSLLRNATPLKRGIWISRILRFDALDLY